MGQVLHGSATTTEAIRRTIQHSQASLRALARRYGINPKTVAKWKKRGSVADLPTGPKRPKSTVLSIEEEAIVIAFRRHTLLPLDDCLYALQATIPHLTRSSLHRCLQRHGISRLPQVEGDTSAKRKFKAYPIGYFHIDIAEVRTEEGKLYLFVAIDRTSKFAFVELHEKATTRVAADFLRTLIKTVPYRVHTVLTDNGTHFTTPGNKSSAAPDIKLAMERGEPFRAHAFELACAQNDIDHRLTKPKHPWTNGQVERMNRTLKEATVKRYYYETHGQLRRHLADFISAYNFARRLKTLKGLTPYEHICQAWTKQPDRFILDPTHQMPGLNKYGGLRDIGIAGSTALPSGLHPLPLPGVAVRFFLPEGLAQASAPQVLLRLGRDAGSRPEETLAHLIDEPAAALPLPDGCAAIPPRLEHRMLWWDPLSALAVLAKCSTHVWLRAKSPSLAAAIARREVSLLIPSAFAARLPKEIR